MGKTKKTSSTGSDRIRYSLLFEGGFEKDFDIVILVYSTPEVQVQRLIQRDKLSPSEAERTMSMQFPIDSKRAHSDYIIENSGEIEQTLRQVDDVWGRILQQVDEKV